MQSTPLSSSKELVLSKQFEMGTDHASFIRLLPLGLKQSAIIAMQEHGGLDKSIEISVHWQDHALNAASLYIQLAKEQSRKIALLSLPITNVTFSFYDLPKDQAEATLSRIMMAMQRGGG